MIKNTLDILKNPKYGSSKFIPKYKEQLEQDGYCLLPPDNSYWEWIGAGPEKIRKIVNSLLEKEGTSAGSEGKEEFTVNKGKKIEQGAIRLGNLLNKNEIFSKYPLERLSRTVTCPALYLIKYSTMLLPIKPAPPVIKNLYFDMSIL